MRSWMVFLCGLVLLSVFATGTPAAPESDGPDETAQPEIPFAPPATGGGPDSSDILSPLGSITPPIHETFQQPAFQVIGDISATRLAGGDIEGEYNKVGFHAGAWTRFAVAGLFQAGAGFTFSRLKGEPETDYESPAELDSPVSSRAQIFGLAATFGQTIWEHSGSAYFSWSVGPAVYRVQEVTELDFEVLEDGLPTGETGHRKESRVHYEPGGDIRLGVKGVVRGVVPVGLNGGLSFIHWNPKRLEPTALDHMQGHTLIRYYAGVSVGYSSRPRQVF
jgi:hypothetical protein